jgi:hypothetical protein
MNTALEYSTRVVQEGGRRCLSLDAHVDQLCKKVSKTLFSLNKIKNFVNLEALKNYIMHSFTHQLLTV